MSAHIPGPWEATEDGGETEVVEAVTTGPKKYVRMEICHAFVDEDDRETHLANLRLIAAAPDLLEACEELLSTLEGFEHLFDLDGQRLSVQQARAAIAKARGK